MDRVIIESPYSGDVEENLKYARQCLKHSLELGEAPIASHLLHTQVLDDKDPQERILGIEAGLAWVAGADLMAVYYDRGMSLGMGQAIVAAVKCGVEVQFRTLKPLNVCPEILALLNDPAITWKVQRALLREKGIPEIEIKRLVPKPVTELLDEK